MSDDYNDQTITALGIAGVVVSLLAVYAHIVIDIHNMYGPIPAWTVIALGSGGVTLIGLIFEGEL